MYFLSALSFSIICTVTRVSIEHVFVFFNACTKNTQTKCRLAAYRGNKLEHNTSGKNQKAITIQRTCMIILVYLYISSFFC